MTHQAAGSETDRQIDTEIVSERSVAIHLVPNAPRKIFIGDIKLGAYHLSRDYPRRRKTKRFVFFAMRPFKTKQA